MRWFESSLALAGALGLSACEITTNLPVKREILNLSLNTEELVCHVRQVSAAQGLRFHYGTSEQPFGRMATFRLIGDDYEITLVNAEKPFAYDLHVYDVSPDKTAHRRAQDAYSTFREALLGRPSSKCSR